MRETGCINRTRPDLRREGLGNGAVHPALGANGPILSLPKQG